MYGVIPLFRLFKIVRNMFIRTTDTVYSIDNTGRLRACVGRARVRFFTILFVRQVLGVEPYFCASLTAALAAGKPVHAETTPTLADGLAVPTVRLALRFCCFLCLVFMLASLPHYAIVFKQMLALYHCLGGICF